MPQVKVMQSGKALGWGTMRRPCAHCSRPGGGGGINWQWRAKRWLGSNQDHDAPQRQSVEPDGGGTFYSIGDIERHINFSCLLWFISALPRLRDFIAFFWPTEDRNRTSLVNVSYSYCLCSQLDSLPKAKHRFCLLIHREERATHGSNDDGIHHSVKSLQHLQRHDGL